jgi:hypothetical protein
VHWIVHENTSPSGSLIETLQLRLKGLLIELLFGVGVPKIGGRFAFTVVDSAVGTVTTSNSIHTNIPSICFFINIPSILIYDLTTIKMFLVEGIRFTSNTLTITAESDKRIT